MQRTRTIWVLAVAVPALFALAGCFLGNETIGSGEAVRTWQVGKLTKVYHTEYAAVWSAASAAVRDMQLSVESEEHDALVGRIRARRSDDIAVRLDLENMGNKQARLVVWVGAIGKERDKQSAMAVMDCVDKKLGK